MKGQMTPKESGHTPDKTPMSKVKSVASGSVQSSQGNTFSGPKSTIDKHCCGK